MHKLYLANERGHTKTQWLDSFHSFSFGNYYDTTKMGFGSLRVINEDIVAPGAGFSTHPHNNMEIISIVIDGALQHKDNMGHEHIILRDDIQKMTAGKGIFHSEFNDSLTDSVHFLQIWIMPNQKDLIPSYEQKHFSLESKKNKFCLIASPNGINESIQIHQEIKIYQSILEKGKLLSYQMNPQKMVWIQIMQGSIYINNETFMEAGDGMSVFESDKILRIHSIDDRSNFLLFECHL